MKHKFKNVSGRLIGGLLLAAGVAAVFFYEVKPQPLEDDTTVRPIKSLLVGSDTFSTDLFFPGTIRAGKEVNLSFEVGGRLIDFPVSRGLQVKEGDILGRLDPSNYENQLKNAEADLEQARSSFERMERAMEVNAVSQEEFSQARAGVQKAEAQVGIFHKSLEDTVLTARFDGRISDTFSDNFDTVAAGHPILKLHDISTLLIDVSIPEGYVQWSRPEQVRSLRFGVVFESSPEQVHPAVLQEFAMTADPITQTYRATFSFDNPSDILLLPGMTGTVVLDKIEQPKDGALAVLSDVLGFASDGQPFVWVLEAESEGIFEVRQRKVKLGERFGENVEVLEGLDAGERIATAGVMTLTEGRRVRLLADKASPAMEKVP